MKRFLRSAATWRLVWVVAGLAFLLTSDANGQDPDLCPAAPSVGPKRPLDPTTALHGLTLDSVWEEKGSVLVDVVDSLAAMSRTPVSRIVFDEDVKAHDYLDEVRCVAKASYVMGEILDSPEMAEISIKDYRARAQEYVDTLDDFVDIWEVGNEVNGNWLGDDVVKKIEAAFDVVESDPARLSALTLYYNHGCSEDEHEMFSWAEKHIPEKLKGEAGLDYVLISYYEDDCHAFPEPWQTVFDRLGNIFQHARIGFGEVGTKCWELKPGYIEKYYGLCVDHPRYVGGYFWWYGRQDLVPRCTPNWLVFDRMIELGCEKEEP